jgi:hypothetical protein
MHADGTPFGVTLLAPGKHDAMLASIGRVFHAATGLPLGALRCAQPPLAGLPVAPAAEEFSIAVVGAHLAGMPLNGELKSLAARLLEAAITAAPSRLKLSADGPDASPAVTAHFPSSIRLTCAATTRQPCAKRTQVCICRPILPGAEGRWNSVEATA